MPASAPTLPKVADLRVEFINARPTVLTRAAYESDFRSFAAWRKMEVAESLHELFSLTALRGRHLVNRWKESMASNPNSTVRRRIGTLRAFSKFLHADGAVAWYLDVEMGIDRDDDQLKDAAPRDMDPPPEDDIARVRAALVADRSAEGRRLLALFDLMNFRGLRVNEILQMDIKDVDAKQHRVRIRGKGRTELEWFKVAPEVVQSIQDWISIRPAPHSGPLFVRMDRGAAATGRRLSRTTVVNGLERIRDTLKIKKRLRPHGLRHAAIDSAIVDGARNGVALTTIQKWARHASFNTTAGYARRLDGGEEEVNASVASRFRKRKSPGLT